MINAVRQEALQLLTALSEAAPDVRLGQLMVNLSYLARGLSAEAIWDMEDEELVEAARKHLEKWQSKTQEPVSSTHSKWVYLIPLDDRSVKASALATQRPNQPLATSSPSPSSSLQWPSPALDRGDS